MNWTGGNSEGTIDVNATVRLDLQSRPECITLVRSMLSGLGESLTLEPELLDDLKTAVSEAANNVVLHAYGGGPGPLRVDLRLDPDGFKVRVRDHGSGIRRVATSDDRMGVGLAVISALTNRAEFRSPPGGGTEVKMAFAQRAVGVATGAHVPPPPLTPPGPARLDGLAELDGDVVATVSPVWLLAHVLGRLLRAVAAGASFTVDRFAALRELTDAIGERAIESGDATAVMFAIAGGARSCEVHVGPLPAGSGSRLFGEDGPSPTVESILAAVSASPLAGGELLTVALVDPRA
jgi:serine/threonine-protein kinase RsbW